MQFASLHLVSGRSASTVFRRIMCCFVFMLCWLAGSAFAVAYAPEATEASSSSALASPSTSSSPSPSPRRVVALAPHLVEILYAIGAGEYIVGTVEYADYPAQAASIPRVGGYHGLDVERILALQADWIVVWDQGNPERDVLRMEELGLNVYRSATREIADIPAVMRHFAHVLGMPEKGEQAASEFEQAWAHIRQQHADKPPVRFFYQLWSQPMRTIGAGSWINEVMASCGGVNIFDDPALDYPQVSMESIVIKAPQAIVIPSQHGRDSGAADYWRAWPEIPAVANAQMVYVDGDWVHRFSPRVILGMQTICAAFDRVRANTAQH